MQRIHAGGSRRWRIVAGAACASSPARISQCAGSRGVTARIWQLGLVSLGTKKFGESAAIFRRAAELSDDFPFMLGWLGLALGLDGHSAEARIVLDKLRALAGDRYVLPTSFAWIRLGLGEIDAAFACLERAAYRNDEWVHALNSYPFLTPFRSDPRFHRLARMLNLEPPDDNGTCAG